MPAGAISFPGIVEPIEMTAVRTNGSTPDRAVIWARPQTTSPDCTGTATLTFGFNGVLVSWTNALCDSGTLQVTTKGHMQVYTIFDSRWRWAKAFMTGHYNARYPDGTIVTTSEKTTSELIQLIFAEIGVSVDVSLVTDTERIEVNWDHERCDTVLDNLLEQRGYVVSLTTSDTAKVWPRGVGTTLPVNDDVVNASFSVDPPEIPEKLRAVGARVRVQSMLKCIPVGRETKANGGAVKEAKELSYNPGGVSVATGWDGIDLVVCSAIADPEANALAKATVGKWYRVSEQASGGFDITDGSDIDYVSGEVAVTNISQLLPISKKLVDVGTDIDGDTTKNDSYVLGVVWNEKTDPADNTTAFSVLEGLPFDLDEDEGIVKFKLKNEDGEALPVLKKDSGTFKFADIYLMCSYSIHPLDTLIKDRYIKDRTLGGYGMDQVENEDLARTLTVKYTTGTSTVTSITDTKATVDTAAELTLDNAQRQYFTTAGGVVLYRGTYLFATDGINLQLQWNCAVKSLVPFGTIVSQYAELLHMLPTEQQRLIARRSRMTKLKKDKEDK